MRISVQYLGNKIGFREALLKEKLIECNVKLMQTLPA